MVNYHAASGHDFFKVAIGYTRTKIKVDRAQDDIIISSQLFKLRLSTYYSGHYIIQSKFCNRTRFVVPIVITALIPTALDDFGED